MEMNTENPFKDCQVLKLNGETTDPTIVYLDEEESARSNSDEENSNPMHLKVSEDEDSNQSMVVEPDDQIVASTVSIRDESSDCSSEMDICLKFEPPPETIEPQSEEIHYEEQFEIITSQERDELMANKEIDHPEEVNEEMEPEVDLPQENDQSVVEIPQENDQSVIEIPDNELPEEEEAEKNETPLNQSFESGGSASNDHDHSYSQSNPKETTSYCDDIVKDILSQSGLDESPQAVKLLSQLNSYLEIFTSNEDPNSQISHFVLKMKDSLNSKEKALSDCTKPEQTEQHENAEELPENNVKEEPLSQPQIEPAQPIEITKVESDISIKCEEVDMNAVSSKESPSQESASPPMEIFTEQWDSDLPSNDLIHQQSTIICPTSSSEENQTKADEKSDEPEEAMDVSYSVVKEEPQENEVIVSNEPQSTSGNGDDVEMKPLINADDAEKLQKCFKSAKEDVGTLLSSISENSNFVYETDEDIKIAKSKLLSSLQQIIKQSCKMLMEIEDIKEDQDVKFDSFIDENMLSLCDRYAKATIKKEEPQSHSDSSDNEETDDEINKLCNINTLKVTKGNRDVEKSDNVPIKKLTKKKEKKPKLLSDDSDLLSSDEEEIPTQDSEKKQNDPEDSSDEEQKMIEKMESNVKNALLASSDEDDSDESTYATSESSMDELSEDDNADKMEVDEEEKEINSKKKVDESKAVAKEEPLSQPEVEPLVPPKEEPISQPAASLPQTSPKEEPLSQPKESPIKPDAIKVKKPRQMDGAMKEIFSKNYLDYGSSSDESSSSKAIQKSDNAPKTTKSSTSVGSSSSAAEKDIDVIDLSQWSSKQCEFKSADLNKYIERQIKEKVQATDAQPAQKPPTPVDDDDCFIISSDSDSEVSSTHEKPRRRKELSPEELKEETKKAQKAEKERLKKLDKKKEVLSQYLTQRYSQEDDDDIICESNLVLDYSEKKKLTIEVHPKLVDNLKEHQKEGIQFMYDNCYGSVDEVKRENGSGCILAHCMGLGKTLQLIALIHTVSRYKELHTKKILVICPKTTIFNWNDEFHKWVSGIPSGGMKVRYLEDGKSIECRIQRIREWFEAKVPAIFLINYESFRSLVNWSGSHKKAKLALPDEKVKKYQAEISRMLLNPGPDLVVCDEGHMIKNQKGAANRAISKVATKRRIILTGTPIQNNLAEYYAMVHWIKPCYLGDIKEFNNLYANPIKEGQHKDSTNYQIKKMKQKCFVLNKMLEKFVQRREASILKEFLPEKYEYCLFVPLSEVQATLYKKFLEANPFAKTQGKQLLADYTALRKIWTHPQVLQIARDRKLRGEIKFIEPQKKARIQIGGEDCDENELPDDVYDTSQGYTSVENDWWSPFVDEDQLKSLQSSEKLLILFELLKQAQNRNEKVLVFTAFVAVLDVIENMMKEINNQGNNPKAMNYGYDQYKTTWENGKDYYRLDGSTPREIRHRMINEFNKTENTRLRCFLISAKAGGQGINLIGANRCVLIDTSWNPSSDQQNIFRIYRMGQKKPCYIYRLVALGTMEEKIYSRSVTKQAMSGRVVDRQIIDRHYRGDELEQLYQFTEYDFANRDTPAMPKDDVLKFLIVNYKQQIYKYHEHESLLENKPEQDLSEAEKKEAWDLYEQDQRQLANRMIPMPNNLYPQLYGNGGSLADGGNYNVNDMMNLNNILNPYQQYNSTFPVTPSTVGGYDFNTLTTAPSTSSATTANQTKAVNLLKQTRAIVKPISQNVKRANLQIDQISAALNKIGQTSKAGNSSRDPLTMVGKNSAASVSILPDDARATSIQNNGRNLPTKSSVKNNGNGIASPLTSARTNAPYVRKNPADASKQPAEPPQKTAYKPNLVPRTQNIEKVSAAPKFNVTPQQRPQQKSLVAPVRQLAVQPVRKAPIATTSGAVRPQMTPARNVIQIQRPQLSGVFPRKTSIDPAIQKQLEKNQTSMIEATKPMQIGSVVSKNGDNSVSIIAINSNQQSSQPRTSKPPSQNAQIAITPLVTPLRRVPQASPKNVNRPTNATMSGGKIVMSPGYSLAMGSKRSGDKFVASPVQAKKPKIQQTSQQTPRIAPSQLQQQQQSARSSNTQPQLPKRPNDKIPYEIVELLD